MLRNKKILITGGAGFIGSNLTEHFLEKDNQVICLDNLITGKKENVAPFLDNANYTFVEGDIRDFQTCEKVVEGVDYVFHQAALGSVPRSIDNPLLSTDINITGFVNVLFAAYKAGVKRFIYAASSSTYGDSASLPKVEDKIGKPLSPYAITKFVNELYADNFSKIYGIETIGLRYFNVFGKNQDPNGAYAAVIPLFIKQFIRHQAPTINGDGLHSRDFTYIKNVIQMNELAATTENPKAINQVFNTAFGENNSLNQLTALMKKYLAKYDAEIANIECIHGDERQGDIKHSLASIDKAKQLLNYAPKYTLEDGLKEAIDWYWHNLK